MRDIIPSHLDLESTPQFSDGGAFSNILLRPGEVQAVVYPDDKRSLSKKFVEYTVFVQHAENGTGVGRIYEHCLLANPLGGLADHAYWTLRAPDQPSTTTPKKRYLGLGSKVLLLCVNGQTNNAVIVGGLRDQADDDSKAKSLGHHLYFVFNGLSVFVDKDGQLAVTCSGKTKIDGKPDDVSDTAGSAIKVGKAGAVELTDKAGKNVITIDPENKKVTIARDEAFELGAATDHLLLGESFRKAEQQLHTQLEAQLQALQTAVLTAASSLNAAGAALAASPAAAAATPVSAAGAALQAAAQVAGQMRQAVQQFEQAAAQKNSFLSDKNSAD